MSLEGPRKPWSISSGLTRSILRKPTSAITPASFCRRLGRDDEALPWIDRALKLRPDYPDAIINKAFSLAHLHRFAEAFALYDVMKMLHPDHAEAEWRRSHLDLLLGNFEAGWAGREARVRLPELPIARFDYPQPRWLGKEPVEGKTILVQMDEGSGDTIQFVRYVPMLAARGARVILMVADALCPLLSELAGVSGVRPIFGHDAAGVRHVLPDHQPAARFRDEA